MDVAYTKHSNEARRKNRSQPNLNHLSLAPLTSKLPLPDHDELPDSVTTASPAVQYYNPSYLQGKSAPATPRLLSSRSPARTRTSSPTRRSSSVHGAAGRSTGQLPKSKSASHLHGLTPATAARHHHHHGHAAAAAAADARDKSDSDWLLHAGAFISTEAREGKGQAWLISRASTTSLTGGRDVEEEAYERELARERELASRRGSRRGSLNGDDDAGGGGGILTPNRRSHSRVHHHPKTPLRTPLRTPMRGSALEHQSGGGERDYFTPHSPAEDGVDEEVPGPDFVSLDEKLEAIEGEGGRGDYGQAADEAAVRRLLKGDRAGAGSWMGSLLGWSLFSVEENDEESSVSEDDNAEDGETTDGSYLSRSTSTKSFHDIAADVSRERVAPPKADEGGWHDAAWLLSVASKVLL
ncbi:hypothetical protein SLS62_010084 [Diatrype stigma]|uniref:Uncharacterized protein n=1 Tax=Diatrype stigma TaxID=117547 RepID=A0AAN9UBI4_9PEZI